MKTFLIFFSERGDEDMAEGKSGKLDENFSLLWAFSLLLLVRFRQWLKLYIFNAFIPPSGAIRLHKAPTVLEATADLAQMRKKTRIPRNETS